MALNYVGDVTDAFRRKRRFGLSGRRLGRSVAAAVGHSKSGRPSRLTQSASSSSLRDALRRQNSRVDFDINNVVIPYGATAAATLIDRQEYKEIVTPKYVRQMTASFCTVASHPPTLPVSTSAKHSLR